MHQRARTGLSLFLGTALILVIAASAGIAAHAAAGSVITTCGGFSDLSATDPACKAVITVQQAHAIIGYPDGTFRPAAPISRAEFAKMLSIVLGKSPAPNHPLAFSDTHGHWAGAQGYLQTAVAAHVITGYPDGTFRPDAQISRAELVKMVSAPAGISPRSAASHYTDVALTDWFFNPVTAAARYGLIGPNAVSPLWPGPALNPAHAATRAEAATLLANWFVVKDRLAAPALSGWTTSALPADCATMDTRTLRVGVVASPDKQGGVTVFLHNNTNLCGSPGESLKLAQSTLQLQISEMGNLSGPPLFTIPMTDLPAQLAPGERASQTADMAKHLPTGWYTGKMIGTVLVNGARADYTPDHRNSGNFMVTSGAITPGASAQAANPAPVVGGVAMPLVKATWSTGSTIIEVAVPDGCMANRSVAFTNVTASARGPGFETQLPQMGAGVTPSIRSWSLQPAPGETRSLILTAYATVTPCNGAPAGAKPVSGAVEWLVTLP